MVCVRKLSHCAVPVAEIEPFDALKVRGGLALEYSCEK